VCSATPRDDAFNEVLAYCAAAVASLRRSFAPSCAVCAVRRGDPVCEGCSSDFLADPAPRCETCANRLARAGPSRRCGRCLVRPPAFDATLVLGDYEPPLDAMIAALKFGARLELGRVFGVLLARRFAGRAGQGGAAHCVLGLPLAFERQRERGFNQSDEIARAIGRHLRLPSRGNGLMRVRHGPPQQSLRLEDRRRNVRGVFAARRRFDGRHVLLVDDVLTSGSTLDEAAAALKRAGAARVTNLVVARTP
jgi:ComF family protein